MVHDECIKAFVQSLRDQAKKSEDKKWNQQKKVMKESLKKYGDWLEDLQKEINKICRLIDFELPCISCKGFGKPQAGHYHSVASDSSIRYNLHNLHIQDYVCNVEKSANIIGYDEGLIQVYGNDYWNYVKFGIKNEYHQPIKLQVFEIKEKISLCREIIKQLEESKRQRLPSERIHLRSFINKQIGIYLNNF